MIIIFLESFLQVQFPYAMRALADLAFTGKPFFLVHCQAKMENLPVKLLSAGVSKEIC
jgi:hypothetical protein